MTQNSNLHSKAISRRFAVTVQPWIKLTRVAKFAGTLVLFWPYAWSMTLAARFVKMDFFTFISLLAFGFAGACLLHSKSGGCIWNDICDREIDRKVARTRNRPLAAGTIGVPGAFVFLAIHVVLLLRMIWNLNETSFRFSILAIFFFPGIYPFMKRITYWPQAWLGLAMNVGVPLPWLALGLNLPQSILVLSIGCWSWTMWYDTIYACQDKRDDVKASVKSTALLFGSWIRPILSLFASGLLFSLFLAGIMNEAGAYYYALSVVGGGLYMAFQMYTVDLDSPGSSWGVFDRNGFRFGTVVWLGILSDYLMST